MNVETGRTALFNRNASNQSEMFNEYGRDADFTTGSRCSHGFPIMTNKTALSDFYTIDVRKYWFSKYTRNFSSKQTAGMISGGTGSCAFFIHTPQTSSTALLL